MDCVACVDSMAKFSLEERERERNGAQVVEGGETSSSSKSKKRVRYFSDLDDDDDDQVEADDCADDGLTNTGAARGSVNGEKEVANAPVSAASAGDASISVIFTDPEVLDCTICFESLTVPVFQCENGHIACSSCCSKLKNKCASCSFPIGYNRCRAIEKVIESVKVLCQNSGYGCNERLSFHSRKDHEDKCIHSPCTCPFDGCNFLGSCLQLSWHCSARHSVSPKRFQYHRPLPLSLDKDCKIIMLQEETDGALFVLINSSAINGNSLTVKFVGPIIPNRVLSYVLAAKQDSSTVTLQSAMEKHSSIFGIQSNFLLVPHDSHRQLKMELCIQLSNSR